MAVSLILVLIPLYLVLGWVVTTWIRAKHGYPLPGGVERRDSRTVKRDALVERLEQRIRVLERIATDDSTRLEAEIDALRTDRGPRVRSRTEQRNDGARGG